MEGFSFIKRTWSSSVVTFKSELYEYPTPAGDSKNKMLATCKIGKNSVAILEDSAMAT